MAKAVDLGTEYAGQIIIADGTRSEAQIRAALTRRCELQRMVDEHDLPYPAWEVTISAATKETVDRHAQAFIKALALDVTWP